MIFEQYNQLHLVGLDSYKDAIKVDIADVISSICWHENVYEALAEIIINACQIIDNNHPSDLSTNPSPDLFPSHIPVCVLVDSLTENQMSIFECLAELEHVDPLAVSSINDCDKLQFATQLGAIRCLEMNQIFQIPEKSTCEKRVQTVANKIIEIPAVSKPRIIIKEYPIRPTSKARRRADASQWLKSNVVKAQVFQEITEPTLTQKELDDLLK